MSYSVKKELPVMAGAFDPIVFANMETTYDTVGFFRFRYVYKVSYYSGTGVVFTDITTIRKYPNNVGTGIVDISRAVQPFIFNVSPTDPNFAGGDEVSELKTYQWVKLEAGFEYATTATGAVTEYMQTPSVYCLVLNGTFFPATNSLNSQTVLKQMCLDNDPSGITAQLPTAIGTREVSVSESRLPVRLNQKGSVGIFNVGFAEVGFARAATYVIFRFYEGATYTEVAETLVNLGVPTPVDEYSDVGSALYQFFCYPGSLEQSITTALKPTTYPNLTRYEMVFRDASTWTTGDPCSRVYVFDIEQNTNCQRGMYIRWMNEFGAWDYFFFDGQVQESQTVKRSEYKQVKGNWFESTGTDFDMLSTARGATSMVTEINDKYLCTTGWITNNQSDMIRSLIRSKRVEAFWYEASAEAYTSANYYPVVVMTSQMKYKKNYPDKLFSYQVEFKYANSQRPTF